MIEKIKNLFTRQVIIGGILLALALCGLVLVLQAGIFPYVSIESNQRAIVNLTPVSTDTLSNATPVPVLSSPEAETLPGVVSIGMTVQVNGTGQDGLRMRANPGTDHTVMFLANEGELFTIIDGPMIKDSLIWWKLQAQDNAQKEGWSVQDYLSAVQK